MIGLPLKSAAPNRPGACAGPWGASLPWTLLVFLALLIPWFNTADAETPAAATVSSPASGHLAQKQAAPGKKETAAPQRPTELRNSFGARFVYIAPGTFTAGSPPAEKGRTPDETPHPVTLTRGFFLGVTEVTVGQWRRFAGESGYRTAAESEGWAWVWDGQQWETVEGLYWDKPGFVQGDAHPVTCVAWNDVQRYIEWLSGKDGRRYRLPTEAEWEYAARAGSGSAFANGEIAEQSCGPDPKLNAVGWYCGNAGKGSHAVAQKQPNAWGLYDMHGNVWEWCQDWFSPRRPSAPVTDPTGPVRGRVRVVRGGSWVDFARYSRSASRSMIPPDNRNGYLGFRLAFTPAE